MPTITIPGFIHAKPAEDWDSSPNVFDGHSLHFLTQDDMKAYGYVLVCPYTLTFEMPEGWDPRAQQVEALQVKKAEHVAAIVQIDRQISNLLAIEYTAEAA
jgi:hypothetical protein